jgi:hypothetical protein
MMGMMISGLKGVVVIVADCNPKDAGFDFRVVLGFFPVFAFLSMVVLYQS